jgi:hypothetical protein
MGPLLLLLQSFQDLPAPLAAPRAAASERVVELTWDGVTTDPSSLAAGALGGTWQVLREQPAGLICNRRVLLQRVADGLPVADAVARVNWLRDGSLWIVGDAAANLAGLADAPALLSASEAAEIALRLCGTRWHARATAVRAEVFPHAAGARRVWSVDLVTPESEAFAFRVRVDARSGEVVEIADLAVRESAAGVNGTGYTFLPNPVQTLNDPGLTDQNDSGSAVPSAAYFKVVLRDLDGSGKLNGPWASTSATQNQSVHTDLVFSAYRNLQVFEEVVGYFHVDAMQRRLQSLGLTARREQQKMDVADLLFGNWEYANASYNQFSNVMTFGTLGVDFAEDADVVIHEYGHSLHDDVQGGIGGGENGAVSEGFSDFLAGIHADDALLGEWVAIGLGGWSGFPAVRRMDGTKRYPEDLTGEVHEDGEIWSGALWEIQSLIGADAALILALEGLGLGTANTGMVQQARNLVLADSQLHGGAHEPYLLGPLIRAGLLEAPFGIPTLEASARGLRAGETLEFLVRDASRPGAEFQIVLSRRATPAQTGPPYFADLDIGTELLNFSESLAVFSGTLNANGAATRSVVVPPVLDHKSIFFAQVMILGAGGFADAVAPPIGFRAERN